MSLEVHTKLRDPNGDLERYNHDFWVLFNRLNAEPQRSFGEAFERCDEMSKIVVESTVVKNLQRRLLFMYARGDSLADLVYRLTDDLPFLVERTTSRRQRWAEFKNVPLNGALGYVDAFSRKGGLAYFSMAAMLFSDVRNLRNLVLQINRIEDYHLYAADVFLKALISDWQIAKKHARKGAIVDALGWADPLVRALAVEPAQRAEAMAAYMRNWCRLMKPFGWKPVRDFSAEAAKKRGEYESLFTDFAFEAALAVCAYDIDDSSFRDHPYYPHDLVDYYRANIRHTRDAWRAEGVGSGLAIVLPPPPKRIELSKSKSKGLARWVELVSDGDAEATAAVIEQVGKLRKVKDLSELAAALAEHGVGVQVDLKDDETLQHQLDRLAQARDLGEWHAQPSPAGVAAAGVSCCEYLLEDAGRWFAARGYVLLQLDVDGDAWVAVLLKADYLAEFTQLGQQLGIGLWPGALPGADSREESGA